jgi:para-nitrobenzyl esterase
VLVYGQSGGGAKTASLLAMPSSYGLFQSACVMSSGRARLVVPGQASEHAVGLLEHLSIKPDDIDRLLELPASVLRDAALAVGGGGALGPFAPVLDGTHAVEDPIDAVAHGHAPDVALLVGTTRDELMTMLAPPPDDADDAMLCEMATGLVDEPAALLAELRAERPGASVRDLQVLIATWGAMRSGSIALADARLAAGGAPVWMYRFDWNTSAQGMEGHAPHGVDSSFFFDTLGAATVAADGPDSLAKQASGAVVALAASGSPQHDGLPEWPAYDTTRRATMLFDVESTVCDDPEAGVRKLFDRHV